MRIGVLGGTGPAGSGLAARLASVGFEIVIGSRSKYRAMEVRDSLLAQVGRTASLHIDAGDNDGAADADLVVIATPWDGAAATASRSSRQLQGKVVISMANALAKRRQGVPAAGAAPRVGGGQRPGRRARVQGGRRRSTTCRPRSWATSTTRSRATC